MRASVWILISSTVSRFPLVGCFARVFNFALSTLTDAAALTTASGEHRILRNENCQLFVSGDFSVALNRTCISDVEHSYTTGWEIFLAVANGRTLTGSHKTNLEGSCSGLLANSEKILELVFPLFNPIPVSVLGDALSPSPAMKSHLSVFAFATMKALLDGPSRSVVLTTATVGTCVIADMADPEMKLEVSKSEFRLTCSRHALGGKRLDIHLNPVIEFASCSEYANRIDVKNLCWASTDRGEVAVLKERANEEVAELQGYWNTELKLTRNSREFFPKWIFGHLRCGINGEMYRGVADLASPEIREELAEILAWFESDFGPARRTNFSPEEQDFFSLMQTSGQGQVQVLRTDHGSKISLYRLCEVAKRKERGAPPTPTCCSNAFMIGLAASLFGLLAVGTTIVLLTIIYIDRIRG